MNVFVIMLAVTRSDEKIPDQMFVAINECCEKHATERAIATASEVFDTVRLVSARKADAAGIAIDADALPPVNVNSRFVY